MPSDTGSDDSDVESKESKEAADVNFDQLTLTDNAHQFLDTSPTSFLDRLSNHQNVTFRELFEFCDALRADEINHENHTLCRLPNIWASDRVAPSILTLAIPHGGNGENETIRGDVLSQVRDAFRNCGMTVDLIESAQQRHPTSQEPRLRMRC